MTENFRKIHRKSKKMKVKNTIAAKSVQEKNKHINNIFLFIVRLLLVMVVIVLVVSFE